MPPRTLFLLSDLSVLKEEIPDLVMYALISCIAASVIPTFIR
jgi:hypothetical protein